MEAKVYHFVPKTLIGNTLYPLSRIREIDPDLAATYMQKYKGREIKFEQSVPLLDCNPAEIINLAAVPLQRIKAIFEDEGFKLGTWRWFEIPASRLDPERTILFCPKVQPWGNFDIEPKDYEPFTLDRLRALSEAPTGLRDHIHLARKEGRQPFVYAGCPHVLYRGTIDLTDVQIREG